MAWWEVNINHEQNKAGRPGAFGTWTTHGRYLTNGRGVGFTLHASTRPGAVEELCWYLDALEALAVALGGAGALDNARRTLERKMQERSRKKAAVAPAP